jgi:hypothetical protein
MGFYSVLSVLNQLLDLRHWYLHRCRRRGDELHFFVTDANGLVLTPVRYQRRNGCTLEELLVWLGQSDDVELAKRAQWMLQQLRSQSDSFQAC